MKGSTCRVCNTADVKFLYKIGNNEVLKCLECSHVFLGEHYDKTKIKNLYQNYNKNLEKPYFKGVNKPVEENIDGYLNKCKEYIRTAEVKIDQKIKLLDIGCGSGILLKRAKGLGFSIEGLEICVPLAEHVKKELSCEIHTEFINDLSLPSGKFDIITMYDLLEHLESPADDLKRIWDLLKPNGVLFILTPNDNAIVRKVSRFLFFLSMRRIARPMNRLYYKDHLSYFTKTSIETLLEKAGFHIVNRETRNQEISRLNLSLFERAFIKLLFLLSFISKDMGGKHIIYAMKENGIPSL